MKDGSTTSTVYLTKEGFEKLRQQIEKLEIVDRPDVSRQIAEAREKGDLSENAEYHAAKEAQSYLELRISKLKLKLSQARVFDTSQIDITKISVLCHVTVKNLDTNTEVTYQLVPENEANTKEKKLSITTPISKGLIGAGEGDEVKIEIPSGILNLKVISIRYDF